MPPRSIYAELEQTQCPDRNYLDTSTQLLSSVDLQDDQEATGCFVPRSGALTSQHLPLPASTTTNITTTTTTGTVNHQTPPKRSVAFYEMVEVVEICHVNEFLDDEINTIWYSADELNELKIQCLAIIERCNDNSSQQQQQDLEQQDDMDCLRGLERHTNSGLEWVQTLRRSAKESVFGMQQFGNFAGFPLPNLLAELYSTSCAPSQQAAYERGWKDAQEAAKVYEEDRHADDCIV